MEKVVLFGNSNDIAGIRKTVDRFVSDGDIEILGISCDDHGASKPAVGYDYPLISENAPEWNTADCVLVCAERCSDEGIRQALHAGAERAKLIPRRLLDMKGFSFSRYMDLSRSRISILSNCCWAGLTYHYFQLEFLSPTINLFITDGDYIRFLENLEALLKAEPGFKCMEYSQDEDRHYPVFDLNGVSLHMNHCNDRELGLIEWKKRCSRVNHSNLLVTMITESVEAAERFDALPFRKKVCFVPFQTAFPSCVSVDPGEVPFVSFVNSFATGVRALYDPWALLEEGRIVRLSEKPGSVHGLGTTGQEDLICRNERILIYGAWALGAKAFNWVSALFKEKLLGFAVTSMKGNAEEKNSYPVRTVEEWQRILSGQMSRPDHVAVILALHPRFYDEVGETLREHGFQRFFPLEDLERLYYHRHSEQINYGGNRP